MTKTWKWILGVLAALLAVCLCVSIAVIAAAGGLYFTRTRAGTASTPTAEVQLAPADTLAPTAALETPAPDLPTPAPGATRLPGGADAQNTLNTLEHALIPINDPVLLAEEYKGAHDVAPTVPPPAKPYQIGDQLKFWLGNEDTNTYRQLTATLHYVGNHVYFWVENGTPFNQLDLNRLMDTFDQKIYETDREFFGSEWTPGIDGDPRLYVLYARGAGKHAAGFFSSLDEIPPAVAKYSNAHEMFVLNADTLPLGDPYAYSVIAHEFQHMIHFHLDKNEESWVNEGFSVLAELLNHYSIGGFDISYMQNPDVQLTDWGSVDQDNDPHYGASFLFMAYFLDRFGEKATQALVANPDNGMDSVDSTLQQLKITDAQTNQPETADAFFADWAVANYLNKSNVADGRYFYHDYADMPAASPSTTIDSCPATSKSSKVHQYGVQYLQVTCSGSYTIDFQGKQTVPLAPTAPSSGKYAFWSNRGDSSDMTLTREFDFSAAQAPLSIQYHTWFDIEKDYDYVFFSASTDGGQTWKTLRTPSGTDKNPGGQNLGWGYTGLSGGWKSETVDLSEFAGKKVLLRFEYLTDQAINKAGFMLDDVSVPALNYQTDFEKDDGGWEARGFVRVANSLPQTYRVSLIEIGAKTQVVPLALDASEHASQSITLGGDVQQVVIVVSGTTRFTTEEAGYTLSIK